MTLKGIEINRTIAEARRALELDGRVSPGLRAMVEVLITIIQLLCYYSPGISSTSEDRFAAQHVSQSCESV